MGVYKYIEGYAKEEKRDVLSVCTELLDRSCAVVALIRDGRGGIQVGIAGLGLPSPLRGLRGPGHSYAQERCHPPLETFVTSTS
jgi:hypothetical protein